MRIEKKKKQPCQTVFGNAGRSFAIEKEKNTYTSCYICRFALYDGEQTQTQENTKKNKKKSNPVAKTEITH